MRLVDVRSKQLVDRKIFDSSRTRYAILSHRWQDAELTLQDLARPDHASLPGYAKLSGACDLAAKKGYDYLWIDTCCIDKTSSAELSEAINSMFRWYEQSAVCYVYLTDVKAGGSVAPPPEVRASEWFKRGWTLQELLAPKTVEFYDADWQFIGTRTSLQKAISEASSIPRRFLSGESHIRSASVAQRMAWAATRQTTRLEDQAYSLMGLFDVNMPLLYGEGRKAFLRLQQEIMKNSSDQSLFAWGKMKTTIIDSEHWTIPELEVVTKTSGSYSGLLATTPARFTGWADRSLAATFGPESRIDLRQTSSGIQMRVPVIRGSQENVRIALLNCRNVDDDKHSVMGLLMARQHAAAEWHRARPVIAPAGGSDDPVYVVPWEIAQYAEYETIETLSTSTWHSALQFPTPNIDGTCGSITLQLADNLPERLHAVTPRGRFRKADHSVLPAFDHSGRWQEVTLFFGPKWSQDVEPKAERGFAVVMRPRSFSEAFWTLAWHSSPFINQVVTLPGEDYVRRFASLHVQSALHQSHGQYVLEIRPGTPPSLITSVYDAFFRTSPNYRTAIAIFLVQLYIHARTLGSETWSSHLVFLGAYGSLLFGP
ncbi:Vegetative incompatibility protein HET-E-1 like [Verticillium longisporum]|uniref:Vegetative incompatibility protein HET-E-1 like n=1 Tax=Verticillium longisporum TaxID=100787 RepID=A0A8I2ZAU2_VERLO|nr:Vegetative incompatibility protein HET-E-1 like [Verticillium longisporum]KAG7125097.1 Vegetative incompatibility protein HET-E-1 like [Verticillium longisporum]